MTIGWSRKALFTFLVLLVAYAVSVQLCIALTREAAGIATVWLADGLLAVGLLVLPGRWRPWAGGLCFLINVLANMHARDSLATGVIFACLNIGSSAVSAVLARRILGPTLRVSGMKRLGLLVLLGAIAVSAVGAALAAAIFHEAFNRSFAAVFIDWLFADGLGTAVVMTALLVLRHTWNRPWENGAGTLESVLLLGILPVAATINYLTVAEPVMFLAFPLLIFISFRMGPRGAAIGTLTLFMVALPLALKGAVPNFATDWDMGGRIRLMQVFIAAVFASSLAAALAVDEQARLRRLLERRHRMARESRARAFEANAAKSEFLAVMSHEIRTPLNSVLGFTGVLLGRKDLPTDARRQIELIDRAGETLLSMVGDVLDFSKIEAGGAEVVVAPADLVDFARGTLEIIAPAAEAKGLTVRFAADAQSAWRDVDARHLRQVLLNLLSNAVKFTVGGEIALSVVTRLPGRVRLEVSDTGIGIGPEGLSRLFRRFSQADGSVSREFGGTGLGLAICKGLVEQMGGVIGVDSKPGEGSRFHVELPVTAARAPTKAAERSMAAKLKGLRVLVIDDHPANREIATALLNAAGCQTVTADGGHSGLQALHDAPFDVVLLDVHMPQVDGLATMRLIRALPHAPPVIAMTADVLPEHVERCLAAGMVDHVAKPIPRDKLYAAVAKWGVRETA